MGNAARCGGEAVSKRWGKGDPVNLSDLLKITPVANEIMQLAEELDINVADILWIVTQIIDHGDEIDTKAYAKLLNEEELGIEEEWGDIEVDNIESDMEQANYTVDVKINSGGRFPEVGFKAGINDREDISYFFDMVLDMLEKLE